jgi:hypothetical protein
MTPDKDSCLGSCCPGSCFGGLPATSIHKNLNTRFCRGERVGLGLLPSLRSEPSSDLFPRWCSRRRGISKFERLVMGPVSERVLSYAHCPVLVTR